MSVQSALRLGRDMLDAHSPFGQIMRDGLTLPANPSAYACSRNVRSALRQGRVMLDMRNSFGQIMRDEHERWAHACSMSVHSALISLTATNKENKHNRMNLHLRTLGQSISNLPGIFGRRMLDTPYTLVNCSADTCHTHVNKSGQSISNGIRPSSGVTCSMGYYHFG